MEVCDGNGSASLAHLQCVADGNENRRWLIERRETLLIDGRRMGISTLAKRGEVMNPNWTKRPRHAPTEIRGPWEGITYPDELGLQVRCTVNKARRSRYYSYESFGGDVLKAHRAAAEWRMQVMGGRKFKLRSKGFRERARRRRADGVMEYSLVCTAMRPDGERVEVKIYIGTQNTATKESRRRAQLRAEMWWGQYRRWYEDGGRHPLEPRA